MISYDGMDDFVLYPGQEAYTNMQVSQQEDQGNLYVRSQYGMDGQFAELAMSTYDTAASLAAFSAPTTLYDAPHFVVDAPPESLKHGTCRYTPPGSPSNSATHSFDHPPSTMSSTSGASVPSANSSAVGSPYSRAMHVASSREPWSEIGHGLGFGPGIVSHDAFYAGDYVTRGLEHEVIFAQDKLPSNFVGKSQEVSPSQASICSTPPSSSLSHSFHRTFTPVLALETSAAESGTRVGSIRKRVGSRTCSPRVDSPSDSGRPTDASMEQRAKRQRRSSPEHTEVFMSPLTPASATGPSAPAGRSSSMTPRSSPRKTPLVSAGAAKAKSSPVASPGHLLHGRPTPPPASPVVAHTRHFQTPFFSQSSGNFVAPLESSCWFSYTCSPFQNLIGLLHMLVLDRFHSLSSTIAVCRCDRGLTHPMCNRSITDPALPNARCGQRDDCAVCGRHARFPHPISDVPTSFASAVKLLCAKPKPTRLCEPESAQSVALPSREFFPPLPTSIDIPKAFYIFRAFAILAQQPTIEQLRD